MCDLVPFDLPTILDTSLDEKSLSPTEHRPIRKSEAEKVSFGLAYTGLRPSCPEKKSSKILIGMKTTKEPIAQANRKKVRAKADENARRHLVRSHLNELYMKILMNMRVQERNKRHLIKSHKPKH